MHVSVAEPTHCALIDREMDLEINLFLATIPDLYDMVYSGHSSHRTTLEKSHNEAINGI